MIKKLVFAMWELDTSMGGPGRSQPAELPRIYGWFRISGLKTRNYCLLGLGGLVCCCVDWAAWFVVVWLGLPGLHLSSNGFRIISLHNVKINRMIGIVERESKRTDGIDDSVELEHRLLRVKHRELHFISTLLK